MKAVFTVEWTTKATVELEVPADCDENGAYDTLYGGEAHNEMLEAIKQKAASAPHPAFQACRLTSESSVVFALDKLFDPAQVPVIDKDKMKSILKGFRR